MYRAALKLAPLLVAIGSCAPRSRGVDPVAERIVVTEELSRFRRYWLEPARVAPPTVDFEWREATSGDVTTRIRPLRPEDAEWNQWPGDGYRLFNNRAALLFEVEIDGDPPLRWVPERSTLELNDAGTPLLAAATPDDLLVPLLRAALVQEQFGTDGDLVDRTRAAGPFRAAYLPLSASRPQVKGVIAFPLEAPEQHVIAFRVRLRVHGADGGHDLTWLYE